MRQLEGELRIHNNLQEMSMEQLDLDTLNLNYQNKSENFEILEEIKRIDARELSYNEFFQEYMCRNIPVIITSTADEWLCYQQWISDSKVNFNNLKGCIRNFKVPVANCSKEYFNSHEKCEMDFHEYLNYWEQKGRDINENTLYLKDWHLKANMPDYDFYKVPAYFASDWLNEYLIDKCKDDYRFVYMGPKGSWTPFHADVFSSFSWSTNIVGLKKWIFIVPPGELKLKDALGNDPFEINESMLSCEGIRFFKVIQKENESIFVPSGWYHQVWNLTDTISINHNWFNGCNIRYIWRSLSENLQKVVLEIDDCRDMEDFEDHCQILLKATFGMNYEDFFDILEHIALKRKNCSEKGTEIVLFNTYQLSRTHVLFDLGALNSFAKIIKCDQTVAGNDRLLSRCNDLVCITESKEDDC